MADRSLGFGEWLRFQADRDDPVGDIARDLLEDRHAPLQATTQEDYLIRLRASQQALAALREAWAEWSE